MLYTNYYENLKEVHKRLRNTVVLHNGLPVYVVAASQHKDDGIIYLYVVPIDKMRHFSCDELEEYPPEVSEIGHFLDSRLGQDGLYRVPMTAAAEFNFFRPFPLGCGVVERGQLYYSERCPIRSTPQGLSNYAVNTTYFTPSSIYRENHVPEFFSDGMKRLILGYSSDVLTTMNQLSEAKNNSGAPLSRSSGLVKAEETFYLTHRNNIVGTVRQDLVARLDPPYQYLRETFQESGKFFAVI